MITLKEHWVCPDDVNNIFETTPNQTIRFRNQIDEYRLKGLFYSVSELGFGVPEKVSVAIAFQPATNQNLFVFGTSGGIDRATAWSLPSVPFLLNWKGLINDQQTPIDVTTKNGYGPMGYTDEVFTWQALQDRFMPQSPGISQHCVQVVLQLPLEEVLALQGAKMAQFRDNIYRITHLDIDLAEGNGSWVKAVVDLRLGV
jgi:hypothetical protein